eukprot:3207704-Amphidinium_carterae.1
MARWRSELPSCARFIGKSMNRNEIKTSALKAIKKNGECKFGANADIIMNDHIHCLACHVWQLQKNVAKMSFEPR